MDKKLDDLLYDALKPANDPDPELNRRILDRKVNKMRKWNVRKTAAAAAIGILVAAGSVSVYAATQHHSLLSLFKEEDEDVRDRAAELLETNIDQGTVTDQEISQWATFKVREAIVDKNKVRVQVEVKAAEPENYLLVPYGSKLSDQVGELQMEGLSGNQTIGEYADSIGKQCIVVQAGIEAIISGGKKDTIFDSGVYSYNTHLEKDGTMVFDISFGNAMKGKNLEYVCTALVYPEPTNEGYGYEELKDTFLFTLTDQSEMELIKYLPVSKQKVPGTNLVIDEVTFERSDLEVFCYVTYHYAGKKKDWTDTTDFDIGFYLLDSAGEIIEGTGGGGGTIPLDDVTCVQSWEYSLKDLPDVVADEGKSKDTIVFQAKDVMEKTRYGTVEVKLAE